MHITASETRRQAGGTRVEPSCRLTALGSSFVYVPSHQTDISKRVQAYLAGQARADAMRQAQQQPLQLEYAQPAAPRVVAAA